MEKGYSPQYGARPMKRAIKEWILNPLSIKILEDGSPGNIYCDFDGKNVIFKK
jgi:ATP-dependent Clp protease ATP-binding subunit ClpA